MLLLAISKTKETEPHLDDLSKAVWLLNSRVSTRTLLEYKA